MTTMNPEIESLREEIIKRTGKTPEQRYEEKENRIRKAVNLEKADRVPIICMVDPSDFTDVPRSAAYYDPLAFRKANLELTLALDTDTGMMGLPNSGYAMELMDVQTRLWPGGNLPSNYEYQFVEGEYMKADEYDIIFNDPTDFMLRYYLPRVYGIMAPLEKLPYLGYNFNYMEGISTMFDSPAWEEMARKLRKAGKEIKKFRNMVGNSTLEMEQLGYPMLSHFGPAGGAPYDTVSSFLRGMQGAMTDMFRQPEKLIKLCDMLQDSRLAQAMPADADGSKQQKRLGMPLWRGDKSFMSQKHFEKFYWPGLKRQIVELVNLGYIPMPVFEDEFGERLECLLELPKAKVMAMIDYTDLDVVPPIVKGHICVMGGGPLSHKHMTIQQVEDYNKNLIDKCARDGGFILMLRLPVGYPMSELQGMIERLKEYAKY